MARSRLVWHVFAGMVGLALAVTIACFGVASVQLASLSDAALAARITDAARSLATGAMHDGTIDRATLDQSAKRLRESTRIRCRLITPHDEAPSVDEDLVDRARGGKVSSRSRYDVESGRRVLEVAVPIGRGQPFEAVILADGDMTESDRALAAWQARLLAGCAVSLGFLTVVCYVLARRLTRPVGELLRAADRLASGDTSVAIPAAETADLAALAGALGRIREQLVERGLTIGRQGSQQEAVLGSMIEGVLAVDARQRLLGFNRAAAELLGVPAEQAAGRPLQEVIRNPDLRRFVLTAIDCRAPVEDDLVLHGPRDRTIRLRGSALRDASGEGGAVVVLNDVTDMQRLENVRRDFVANVSHELKTPIASIKGFVETLLDGAIDNPDDSRRFLEIIARQSDRLASIIEDLLALSRIEQSEGAGNLPRESVVVADLLAAVTDDCGVRSDERSIRIATDCAPSLTANLNAPLVEQALINLVDNAVKYSDPGRTVWLSAETDPQDAGSLILQVRDEGCGIAAEHVPRLFERFYRVDKARSRVLGGTGLGLSIVKHIVQAHGGTVAVESTPGIGSTFTLRLPKT